MKNNQSKQLPVQSKTSKTDTRQATECDVNKPKPSETGGPKGPEPTRYGDWEQAGRCTDF